MNKKDQQNLKAVTKAENRLLKHMLVHRKKVPLTAFKHGLYTSCLLNEKEEEQFQLIFWEYARESELMGGIELHIVQMIALESVQYARAIKEKNTNAAEQFDRMIRNKRKELKTIRNQSQASFSATIKGRVPSMQMMASFLENKKDKEVIDV